MKYIINNNEALKYLCKINNYILYLSCKTYMGMSLKRLIFKFMVLYIYISIYGYFV